MVPESVLAELAEHSMAFVEKPHPQFHNLPICPFAKKARIEKQIQYEICTLDIHDMLAQIESWRKTDKLSLVLVIPDKDMQLSDYLLHFELIKATLPIDLSIFEAHPDSMHKCHGVLTRREPYPNFQIMRTEDLDIAQSQLSHSGWYEDRIGEPIVASGISRLTAAMIKHGEITTDVIGPVDGKYGWWITFWKEGRPHIAPLVSAEPHYDTKEEAQTVMDKIVSDIRAMEDL